MKGITRRQVLEGLGLAIGSATLGAACSDGHTGGKQDAGGGVQGAPDLATAVDQAAPRDMATGRDAAARDMATPADMAVSDQQLLASFDTIVVLMMENRSFDHYLRWGLPPLNARTAAANTLASCIDPNLIGKPQAPPKLPLLKLRRSRYLNRPTYSGEHPELLEALERGHIPRRLDRRGQTRAITERILAEGVRLGTVQLLD